MTDWQAIADARKLDIPPEQIAKIAPVLEELEAAFRPLTKELPLAYAESE